MQLRLLPTVLVPAAALTLVLDIAVLGQQSAPASSSLAEAARAAQAQKPNSSTPAKVITNDDLATPSSPVATTATSQGSQPPSTASPQSPPENSKTVQPTSDALESGGCHNPDRNDAIQGELQAAQDELDQLRRELAENPMPIPNQNIDMTNFKPTGSGVDLGSPPLSDAQPQSPDRIKEVELQQRIASLKRAAVITCDSPENGAIQRQIDDAQKQLILAQRELDLDSSTYYSNPNYTQDTAGKAKVDAEQEQVQTLQSEVERLKQELAASQSN